MLQKKIDNKIKFLGEGGGGVTYFFAGGIKYNFGYVGVVLIAEINIYMNQKLLVFHYLILSKDYVAHFAEQL